MSHYCRSCLDWQTPIALVPQERPRFSFEMEFFAYNRQDRRPFGSDPSFTHQEFLRNFLQADSTAQAMVDPLNRELITGVLLADGATLSIEPGGQIEVAPAPATRLSDLIRQASLLLQKVEGAAQGRLLFASHGTNPYPHDLALPLMMPKARYQTLTRYFAQEVNGRGNDMAHFTATVQPNLDLPAQDGLCNMDLLWFLIRFSSSLFANSLVFRGQKSRFASERQAIWKQTDPSRTGVPAGVPFSGDNYLARYCQWAMGANVMMTAKANPALAPDFGSLSFQQWMEEGYQGQRPTEDDWKTHLSTLFPILRLRKFLEIRSVDAQRFEHTLAPVLFFHLLLNRRSAKAAAWQKIFEIGGIKTGSNPHICQNPDLYAQAQQFYLASAARPELFSCPQDHLDLLQIALESLDPQNAPEDRLTWQILTRFQHYLREEKPGERDLSTHQLFESLLTERPSELLKMDLCDEKKVALTEECRTLDGPMHRLHRLES